MAWIGKIIGEILAKAAPALLDYFGSKPDAVIGQRNEKRKNRLIDEIRKVKERRDESKTN